MKRPRPKRPSATLSTSLSHWKGRTILITAGPTREALDPVRFLSNSSSGRMGYALAETAQRVGARVILVSGPTTLKPPARVKIVPVISARQMLSASVKHAVKADLIIGAAAVADWRPARFNIQKIKKSVSSSQTLRLVKNPDIIKALSITTRKKRCFIIGFALETKDLLNSARRKMMEKSLDMVVANPASVIDNDRTSASILRPHRPVLHFHGLSKKVLAGKILSLAAEGRA